MSTYKFYYINLDKSKVRRDFMVNQFQQLNIPITRYSAVYGKELPALFLKKAKSQFNILAHYPNLNDGEIGLTKTYFELFQLVAKQKEDYAIILEDDALINPSFLNDLENIFNESTTFDFIDISGRNGFIKLKENRLTSIFLTPSLQTTAQIIGKNAAQLLSKNLNSFYAPIDVLKQDVYKHKVRVLTTNKSYVQSNDAALGGTTLQKKGMPKIKKIFREIGRPFWQLITLLTYIAQRCFRNYLFYKSLGKK